MWLQRGKVWRIASAAQPIFRAFRAQWNELGEYWWNSARISRRLLLIICCRLTFSNKLLHGLHWQNLTYFAWDTGFADGYRGQCFHCRKKANVSRDSGLGIGWPHTKFYESAYFILLVWLLPYHTIISVNTNHVNVFVQPVSQIIYKMP